jgi:hypothetical protein
MDFLPINNQSTRQLKTKKTKKIEMLLMYWIVFPFFPSLHSFFFCYFSFLSQGHGEAEGESVFERGRSGEWDRGREWNRERERCYWREKERCRERERERERETNIEDPINDGPAPEEQDATSGSRSSTGGQKCDFSMARTDFRRGSEGPAVLVEWWSHLVRWFGALGILVQPEMVNSDAIGIKLESATALAAFGSGLGSVCGVRLGPGTLRQHSAWAWAVFGLGGGNVKIWALKIYFHK